MNGDERCVNGDGDGGQMKIVEENRQMIMKSFRGWKMQLERATGNAGDAAAVAVGRAIVSIGTSAAATTNVSLVGEPEFNYQMQIKAFQSLFNLKTK